MFQDRDVILLSAAHSYCKTVVARSYVEKLPFHVKCIPYKTEHSELSFVEFVVVLYVFYSHLLGVFHFILGTLHCILVVVLDFENQTENF